MLEMEFNRHIKNNNFLNLKQILMQKTQQLKLIISCCCLCGNACQRQQLLCQHCQTDLPYFKQSLLGFDLLQWPAVQRIMPKAMFDQLLCLAPYRWPFSYWISQLKYQGRADLAILLANLTVQHWQEYLASISRPYCSDKRLVLSVPLHINKWQQRGFNQAHLIAKYFAKQFNYTYQPELLIREKATQSQVGKSGVERRKNLANAFIINSEFYHQQHQSLASFDHIILIDDVVTTGTTANEICKLLKKQGAQSITLLSICLAIPD